MKRKAALWNGLGILFAISVLKNACYLWRAYAYSQSMGGNYIGWVTLTAIIAGLILLFAIVGNLFRAPFVYSAARIFAFALALYIPSYEWPREAWKIEFNAARYNELIARVKTEPKIVILDRIESALSINGVIVTSLIYDESDQIWLPDQFRSNEWRNAVPENLTGVVGEVCRVGITKVKENYFFIKQDCT